MYYRYMNRTINYQHGVFIVEGSNLEFPTEDDAIAFIDEQEDY